MTYLYERLGDERFQQFCQALLLKEFPDLQCFPVGQPDGGRDAVSREGGEGGASTVVQVKFRRADEKPSADWMISALKKELPKIRALVEAGARRYIMTTNASSSAHPTVGTHDRVQAWLDDNVTVPAEVYWRDELDRRFENAEPGLKLSYPSLLTGDDALTLIIAAQMGPNRERVTRTLRAFVSEQFRKDEDVKFRQVDLTRSLLDLFVDVPLDVGDFLFGPESQGVPADAGLALHEFAAAKMRAEQHAGQFAGIWHSAANTADVLLDPRVQAWAPWVILQGAPGQGKSTIAQYVCQVHRARFLGRDAFLEAIVPWHANTPFRLPIKVDLRDYSAYLTGQPYLNVESSDPLGARSLERFLASLVSIQSGGRTFSVEDFAEAANSTPLLVFLDGLDEVANIKQRRTLIENILQGLNRLRDDDVDVQVVITSRPSLFGRKFGLGESFRRLELAPIGTSTVNAYCEKWMTAKRLDDERASEIRAILQQKLDQPHIRELTRNPMQLAILLNLIHSVGHSLPDARTSLYREYVNLFMNREAEKTAAVRKHRAIISGIVEHLAWMLQAGAETKRGTGSIEEKDLRVVVVDYLARNQLPASIAEEVFIEGIERVWVLVQRVEGQFEFEVQPLREYFAARHLYVTAPTISYPHDDAGGDRSERFEAIAANPYWSNVARFYAGFYQSGEIASLERSLSQLAASEEPAVRLIARSIAVELVADWIFNLKKAIQRDVLEMALDPAGINLATVDAVAYRTTALPEECGRDHVADLITSIITAGDADVAHFDIAWLLRNNVVDDTADRFRSWITAATGRERMRRINIAIRADALSSGDDVLELVDADGPDRVEHRLRTRSICIAASELMDTSPALADAVLQDILDGGGYRTASAHPVAQVASILAGQWFITRRLVRAEFDEDIPAVPAPQHARDFVDRCRMHLDITTSHEMSVVACDRIITTAREVFGDHWAVYRLAATTAGNFARVSGKVDTAEILNPDTSLLRRARLARAYRGRATWWMDLLSRTEGDEQLFWLAILLCWSPSNQVRDALPVLEDVIGRLDADAYARLHIALQVSATVREDRRAKPRTTIDATEIQDERLATLLFRAFGFDQLPYLPKNARDSADIVRALAHRRALHDWTRFPGWAGLSTAATQEWLEKLRAMREVTPTPRGLHGEREMKFPDLVAQRIMEDSGAYPRESAVRAYQSIMARYTPQPVGDIARKRAWALE